jgi:hypothetical protein
MVSADKQETSDHEKGDRLREAIDLMVNIRLGR